MNYFPCFAPTYNEHWGQGERTMCTRSVIKLSYGTWASKYFEKITCRLWVCLRISYLMSGIRLRVRGEQEVIAAGEINPWATVSTRPLHFSQFSALQHSITNLLCGRTMMMNTPFSGLVHPNWLDKDNPPNKANKIIRGSGGSFIEFLSFVPSRALLKRKTDFISFSFQWRSQSWVVLDVSSPSSSFSVFVFGRLSMLYPQLNPSNPFGDGPLVLNFDWINSGWFDFRLKVS